MNLKSGISKEPTRQFIVDEDALIRIKGVLDKAVASLDKPARVVFHVEREDDRFYETTDLEDVVADPNILGKKVSLLGVEIREENPGQNSRRDWIARVVFIAEKRYGVRFKDNDEIHIDISTSDKNWALLLADELEPQIERTINRSKMPTWPLWGLGLVLLYGVFRVYRGFNNIISEEFAKGLWLISSFMVMIFCITFLLNYLISGKTPILKKVLGPETAFLWGDEEKRFREREQFRKNVFWGVVVAFVVSALASIAVTAI